MTMYDDYDVRGHQVCRNGAAFCRTCCYWGLNPVLVFSNETGEPFVIADCSHCSGLSGQEASCDYWRPRSGQPLGTGILPFWFQDPDPANDWKSAPSILHDLRYDHLQPGESTQDIDKEWWINCRMVAGEDWSKRRIADVGWIIIRAYGLIRGWV